MAPRERWVTELEQALSVVVKSRRPVFGGDINEAWEVILTGGDRLFVKVNREAPPRLFHAEEEGLTFLRKGLESIENLIVPEVFHVGEGFLVMEFLETQRDGSADALGRGIAALHRAEASKWGAPRANFIGTLGQLNETRETWSEFFIEKRLRVQLELPGARRLINPGVRRSLDALLRRLPPILETQDAPSRLHGDLWSGNYCYLAKGAALFDPAAYVGHREVDLAMMRLFGGFDERVFSSYQKEFPLLVGFEQRIKVYQLYPLLVHLNLFGTRYVSAVERALRSLVE